MTNTPRNDRKAGVTKFCRALEEHRRTEAGRVKNARELVDAFFPWTPMSANDRVFRHIPREVRGPVVSGWGIRGTKSALKDDDDRVRAVVHDALLAGDIDENSFEAGLSPEILVDWLPLPEWWTFWRSGRITGAPVQRALAIARELGLFDDRWFLENLKGRGGRLSGTDVVCDTLSKDQIVAWIRNIHQSGDGSPAGIVAAIGWEVILAKTAQDALLHALDALATKVKLAAEGTPAKADDGVDVAIPDLPAEERNSSMPDAPESSPDDGAWPDAFSPPKPSYNLDRDDEKTSEHAIPPEKKPASAPPKA